MGMRIAGLVAVLLMAWSTARSDVVTTVDGASFEGNVVSNDALGITVETTSGTVTLPKEVVRSVGAANADPTTAPALRPGQRLRGWLAVVTELSAQPWAREVRQAGRPGTAGTPMEKRAPAMPPLTALRR